MPKARSFSVSPSCSLSLASAVIIAAAIAMPACKRGDAATRPDDAGAAVATITPTDAGDAVDDEALAAESDGGAGLVPKGAREVELVGAMNFQTSILSETDWPPDIEDPKVAKRNKRARRKGQIVDAGHVSTSRRIGYLRHGATAEAITIPIPNEACPEGWFELVVGGFVCGKSITFDLKNPRVTRAPHAPDMKAPLPYVYGAVVSNGTPVYRRVLSKADRATYEAPPAAARDAGDGEGETKSDDNPYKEVTRERLSLEDLRGRGVLVRKLARGFILALDRDFKAADAQWWRTTGGFAVPRERIFPMASVAESHGGWLAGHSVFPPFAGATASDAGAAASANDPDGAAPAVTAPPPPALAPAQGNGTVVFVKSKVAHSYTIVPDENRVTWGPALLPTAVVELTGPRFLQGGVTFRETTAGYWVRPTDGLVLTPVPPEDLGPGEKWVDVDMTLQTLVAFEGMKPVFAARISTGKRNAVDHEKDHPTPAGTFRIREKHITATMDADTASDGPYSIEDVPWVMYFEGSYALHGAFWHNAFGNPRSHGCVNMAPPDAKELFGWVEPRLPDGWHGVYATESVPGTRVVIHGEAK